MTTQIDYDANMIKAYQEFVKVANKFPKKGPASAKIELELEKAYNEYSKAVDLYIQYRHAKR